jgi:amino acid adenylation domain-containing protein
MDGRRSVLVRSGVGQGEVAEGWLTTLKLDSDQLERIECAAAMSTQDMQDVYPLSPLQEGLLFHHLLDQVGDTYVIVNLLKFESRQHLDSFIGALQFVINRHDVLRTCIVWKEMARPLQVVHRHVKLPVEELKLPADVDPVEHLSEIMRPERQHMDLTNAPLVRLQVAPDKESVTWYAVLQIHHLICDAQSLQIMIREVFAVLRGDLQSLVEPVQFGSHVAELLADDRAGDTESFFRRKLSGVDEPSAPFGLYDVYGDSTRIEDEQRELEPHVVERIRLAARRLRVSVAAFFHAAWAVVVATTSGREDVVYGTVLFGRLRFKTTSNQRIGLFLNTLPLRLRIQTCSVKELLQQTQYELLELMSHEQSSLALAQRSSGMSGGKPLFASLLNYRHGKQAPGTGWTAAEFGMLEVASRVATNYPITFSVDEVHDRITLTAQTDRQIRPGRVVDYMEGALSAMLAALETAPNAPVLAFPILPRVEHDQVVVLFNATAGAPPKHKLVHELFEAQVHRTPQALAVEHGSSSLTYFELNRRANRIADRLRAVGVRPGEAVGVCMPRGTEMVIGLVAILKAGASYLPLDPNYPRERLDYMLSDSGVAYVLIMSGEERLLPAGSFRAIPVEAKPEELNGRAGESTMQSVVELSQRSPVYVIYTSGSTGKPKAVVMEHGSVANLLEWHRGQLHIGQGRRVLQFAALSFDVAFQETFCTLCMGGTLVMLDEWIRKDFRALCEFLASQAIDTLFVPPVVLQGLAECCEDNKIALGSLQHIITAGEQLRITREIVALFHKLQSCRLHNHYGPTETHVVTAFTLAGKPEFWPLLPSIGRPIDNVRIYILNGYGQPVPVGVVGEIYIGGVAVARGYLGRPEMTQQRFVSDPFDTAGDARMYRTGDLGRWQPDGTIEYLGRNDQQVKVRGFRVELGEIEAHLGQHPEVKECVVIVREDEPSDKYLVAYLIPRVTSAASRPLRAEELRTALGSLLPEHMVPSAFVLLDKFPLTPNGKLDRRALPAPSTREDGSRPYELPRGEVEEIVAGIWESLLHRRRVGRYDNFFELGGHSLLIVRMMERLRRVGLSVDARRVFKSQTLEELASSLTSHAASFEVPENLIPQAARAITPQMLPLLRLHEEHIERLVRNIPGGAANVQDIYPLSPIQEGLLFHHVLDEQGGDVYARVLLLSISGGQSSKFVGAVQEVVDRHDILRTAILWEHLPHPVQVVCRHTKLPVTHLDLDWDRDPLQQMESLMRPELQRIDLRLAPLIRLQIAADPRSDGRDYILLQTHHLVCDNESLGMLLSELGACFAGRGAKLPEPSAYRNHIAQILKSTQTLDAEAFFRKKLGDVDEPTLPFSLLNVRKGGGGCHNARAELDAQIGLRLRARARRMGVSAATLFHAAWALVVGRLSDRDDVVYGTVLSGRLNGSAGSQRILGMFINTLPLRLKLACSVGQLVEQTQRELIELLGYEQASLVLAQRCSGVSGSMPLFNALLNYRHAMPGDELDASASSEPRLHASAGGSNYPIWLTVVDTDSGFELWMDTDKSIDPTRMLRYTFAAVSAVLAALDASPSMATSDLSILPDSERLQILEVFNSPQAPQSVDCTVHQLFEASAARAPHRIAVEFAGTYLTYAELDEKSSRLANRLRELGVAGEQLVAVCVDRNLEMVIALLAVLKSGAAYVPLDPAHPTARLTYMLRESGARVLITQQRLRESFSTLVERVVVVDTAADQAAGPAGSGDGFTNASTATGRSLAYIIYTSGSTGEPKGVMVEHAGIVNLLHYMSEQLSFRSSDCVLAITTLSFDIAALEIFLPLTRGARLVLAAREETQDPAKLIAALARTGASVMQATPAMWRALVNEGWEGQRSLTALCGGEALTTDLSNSLRSRVGALWNMYGPTETTIWSCCKLINGQDDSGQAIESIGGPVAHTRAYIVGSRGDLLPIGSVGEIYIGGVGVARGYLNKRELTAARFVADPWVSTSARMYKTGDLGRWKSDGTIEFLGRNDHQVKIRGFRIELGEIEAQLRRYPQVEDAVVLAREDRPGESWLIAYWIARAGHESPGVPVTEELRSHLRLKLPEYMIPSVFMLLPRMPLTPNGKIDRRALPTVAPEALSLADYQAPRGEIEKMLAEIWAEVLGIARVGRTDNFFELGGHSLTGMKVIGKVASAARVRPPVATIFQYPTIEAMARLVDQLLRTSASSAQQYPVGLEDGVI